MITQHIVKNIDDARNGAAEQLRLFLRSKEEVLFLTSGGSAFSVLECIDVSVLGSNVTVAVLDERYSYDEDENNFSKLTKTSFYQDAVSQQVNIFNTSILSDETEEELAKRFDTFLHEWKQYNKKGVVVALFGIGADGHTAGISAGMDQAEFSDLFENTQYVVSYDSETLSPSTRITTTFTFLKQIDHGVCFAVGEEKKEALQKVFTKGGSIAEIPARMLHVVPDVHLYTDVVL